MEKVIGGWRHHSDFISRKNLLSYKAPSGSKHKDSLLPSQLPAKGCIGWMVLGSVVSALSQVHGLDMSELPRALARTWSGPSHILKSFFPGTCYLALPQ